MDSGRKAEYYITILSGKNAPFKYSGTVLFTSTESNFIITLRMHNVLIGPNAYLSE